MEDQTKEKLSDRMEAAEPGFKAQLEADYRQRLIDVQKHFEKGGIFYVAPVRKRKGKP